MRSKDKVKNILRMQSPICKILYDYYWMHRNYRVSRFHHAANLSYTQIQNFVDDKEIPNEDEILKIIAGLEKIKNEFNNKINYYVKELKKEYGINSNS